MPTTVDPITTEVIRNALNSAAEEMNATLFRSAYTWIIYELRDCSVALLDAEHRVLGQSSGLPIFLGNLEVCTKLTEETYGRDVWQPGDVWALNDSYLAGTHLNDISVFSPIFYADRLVGFGASRAHWLDVGAKDPGSPMDSTDIWQEGIRMGPLQVAAGGRVRPDIVDLLGRNSRFSYPARGDLMAQIACARTGEKRLQAIVERFGLETLHAARDAIFEQTARIERAAVAAIPDGVYEAEGCIDDNGLDDAPVRISVKVTVAGEQLEIDLSGTDDMQRGPVNCGRAQAVSACRVAYKTLIDSDRPPNGGAFEPLDVKVREGSLLAAEEPAPCAWYFTTLGLLIDLVVKALAPAIPDLAAGASYGDSMVFGAAGIDPRSNGLFFHLEPTVGGWGAWRGSDGEGSLINNVNGAMKDFPVEILETKVPLRVRRYAIRPDSGGAGEWRGGNGVIREFELLCDETTVYLWWERSKTPAWGLFGGHDGAPPEVVINPGREDTQRRFKSAGMTLRKGDVVRGSTGGGGGYGDASQRARTAIEEDIANGDVSVEAARRLYGYEGGTGD